MGGNFVASLITMADHDWKFGMMLPGIAGALVAIAIWLTPESPRYVMSRKGQKPGTAVLQAVRRGDVEKEAKAINDEILLEEATGQVSFLSYAVTFFKDLGVSNPFLANTFFQLVMLVGVI